MPRVLLLIPSASYRAADFLDAAARIGVEVVVGSDGQQALEALHPGCALRVDLAHPERGTEQVVRFAGSNPLAAIVAVDDGGAVVAALASRQLGLPHHPVHAVRATRNKYLMRERMVESDVPSPHFHLLRLDGDARRAASEVRLPAVLKPLSLSGSRGVIRADDPEGFAAAFERVRRLLRDPSVAGECGEPPRELLVEDYIPGDEVSLEGLLLAGRLTTLALFDKPDPLVGPFFEETIYVTPSRLPPAQQALVIDTAERAARALGLRDGPVHAELRVNERGAWPVDIAARSIGGLCSRTLSFGTGLSLEEIILRHAVGAPITSLKRESAAAGVMMIPIPAAGVLREVRGVAEAEAVPSVVGVTISIRRGQPVVPLPEGSEYLGFILARGTTPAAVEAALRAAHARLRFEIEAPREGAPLAFMPGRPRSD